MSICLFVNTFDSSSAGVVHILECRIPFKSDGCGARHACLLIDALGSRVAGEMLIKDAEIVILLLVERWIDREAFCSMCHLLVADGF